MRPSQRRKWKDDYEPSPREKREMMERGEWVDDDEASSSAPLIFRFLAWTSIVVIFFAVGYGVTSLVFSWLDKTTYDKARVDTALVLSDSPVSGDGTELTRQTAPEQLPAAAAEQAAVAADTTGEMTVTISIPDGKSFTTRQIRCAGVLREDRMKQVLAAYLDAMKENKMLGAGVSDLNIFQSGDWLYLNMNGAFLESVKSIGADKARIMLTGMVKTMTDNFHPINKIKFYVDGKDVLDKKPVDLSAPWGINARSS